MKKIAIFASGSGTNAERIAKYFAENQHIKVSLILSNNKNAFVLDRADRLNIESVAFSKTDFYHSGNVLHILQKNAVDWVILAGFLWLVPENLIQQFPQRILNIHPALLPKYGGKGMYGARVHEAVLENHEKESGITIHFVNGRYDEGQIVFQAKCNVDKHDTPDSLAQKIHQLEYKYFPEIIEKLIMQG